MQEKKRYFTCSPGFMLSASMSLSNSVSGRPSENAPHSVLIICSYNFESIQFDDIYSPTWKNDFFFLAKQQRNGSIPCFLLQAQGVGALG
jgi:hypothetical protein